MLFEQLKAGKVKKWTKLPVSRFATQQEPSSLGLKKGQWITVENAIKALVTKSANDVAVVIAEYIGGSEARFATKMTKKARDLGMKRTTFKNASGLPNIKQVTTAKDMAILGIKIEAHFPVYFKYFKTSRFKYNVRVYGNHNKLLGKYKGVDGIKTGYIRASGFNLVSSVKRSGKSVVAVVMGGKTSKSRDAHMIQLLDKAMPRLSVRKATPKTSGRIIVANAPKPLRPVLANGSLFPVPPNVINVAAKIATTTPTANNKLKLAARLTPMPKMLQGLTSADKVLAAHNALANGTANEAPLQITNNNAVATPIDGKVKKDESRINYATTIGNTALPLGYTPTLSRKNKTNLSPVGQKIIAIASARFIVKKSVQPSVKTATIITDSIAKDSWAVQVGAYANQNDAKKHLDKLSNIMTPYDAQYYIPSVKKGNKLFYRARFAGLTKSYARKACSDLKRKGYSCLALKNN